MAADRPRLCGCWSWAGIGTMIERLNRRSRTPSTSPSTRPVVIRRRSRASWATGRRRRSFRGRRTAGAGRGQRTVSIAPAGTCTIRLSAADAFDLKAKPQTLTSSSPTPSRPGGHAILESISQCSPRTLLYFTINFDGATILEPKIDPALTNSFYGNIRDNGPSNRGRRRRQPHRTSLTTPV